MVRYAVYLETGGDGRWLGHVLALPGCSVKGAERAQVLDTLRLAVTAHHAWLRDHGEAAPGDEEPVELEVWGEVRGIGPFHPGDASALFPPDREAVTPEEMEAYFRLMGHARADLLALTRDLCDQVLDWEPGPEEFSIRRVLRHVGNAEQWYVSRLVQPETLPPEWQDDENLPLWEFLTLERRTVLGRLRALRPEERGAVVQPTAWTDHPEEAWTLRKVLRRALEHEREHAAQILGVLCLRRGALLDSLNAARAELLVALSGLEPSSPVPACGNWTVADLVGHLADWEWVGVESLRRMGRSESPLVELVTNIDAWNQEHVAARRVQPWPAALDDLHSARRALLELLRTIEPAILWQSFPFPWGGVGLPEEWLSVYPAHDREHAEHLAAAPEGAIQSDEDAV